MLQLLLTVLLFVESPKDVDSGPVPEAQTALREDLLSKVLHYINSNPETVEELASENDGVLGGDMMSVCFALQNSSAVGTVWPTQEIPYVISPALASRRKHILSAMKMVSKDTCVSFHKRTSETNYLLFTTSNGCASSVGFLGGEQPVYVGPTCLVGNIVHEILHALGIQHEHTRTDRDQYIAVLPHNIMPGMEKNFKKQEGETFDLPYDVTSIMHYGSVFFSSNGRPTIVPKNNVKDMGQRVKMTKMDIEKVRRLYNCDAETQQESSGDGMEVRNMHVVAPNNPVSANKPEKNQTSTVSPSTSLQHLTAATRGNSSTSRGHD
ncbi:astacin-like metalloendopeptidase isoform X2 [Micropterus salmoides]|uniref:astacin-like metalloendopeptidase isoform X2 n=1 Tax=Micropterus salmoides TaxID=27706 RepID=UPI0018EAE6D9|nr:astacin-like metalloendopeptidase isoform X2 [Micropterus salmoides]